MNFNIKKLNLLRSELIRMVGFLLIVLVIINVLVYNTIARLSYLSKLRDSNDMLVSQIGISYETMLSYMADNINKIAIFDFAAIDLEDLNKSVFDFHTAVTKELTSIVTLNGYIHSAYLYIPDINKVYNSMNNYPRITALESFNDNDVFLLNHPGYTTFLEPRKILDSPISQTPTYKTVITIISPIAIKNCSTTPYIALNISADRLYSTILKNTTNMSGDVTLYAFNQNNTIVVHSGDSTKVSTELPAERHDFDNIPELQRLISNDRPLVSTYRSSYLGWTFVLESPANLKGHNLNGFVTISVISIILVMFLIIFFIVNKTKPVNNAVIAMQELLWKDVIKDNITIDEHVYQQLRDFSFISESGGYGMLAVCLGTDTGGSYGLSEEIGQTIGDLNKMLSQSAERYKIIQTDKNIVTIVVNCRNNNNPYELRDLAVEILAVLPGYRQIFIGVSNLQKHFGFLPLCYKECLDALNYKICLNSGVLQYSLIKENATAYEYPAELVRQLVNNITVGNSDFCAALIDKLFAPFEQKRVLIDDTQFFNFVISLQNSVLKTISAFPVPVKVNTEPGINGDRSLENIKTGLKSFLTNICNEINAMDEDRNYKLFSAILEYMDQNCFSDSISLTQAADDLSINKNYLSRIVKEITGHTFNEYINKNRIERSKELLKCGNKTIEDIASEVGFSYSYYFIKIFKALEGVTPGQYRSNTVKNGTEIDGDG